MEKLELKHLAPYLPYGVHLFNIASKSTHIINLEVAEWITNRDIITSEYCSKLILRPLSDLTKEIEHNGEKFVPKKELEKLGSMPRDILYCYYPQIEKLFEWHFDVFGLIEKGLAIDINTL